MQKKLFFFHTFALVTAMAITQAVTGDYDLILLDLMRPGAAAMTCTGSSGTRPTCPF